MDKLTYSEKLKDPRWQKKRLKILERDGFKCLWCHDEKTTLHVHHKRYIQDRDPWDYEDIQLMTLCECCHSVQHLYLSNRERFLYENVVATNHGRTEYLRQVNLSLLAGEYE